VVVNSDRGNFNVGKEKVEKFALMKAGERALCGSCLLFEGSQKTREGVQE
jgi:hypothetical protein